MSVDRFSRLSAVLGRVVLGAEALALTLWLVAPQALPAVVLHRSPTKPSTVLAFLLLGLALGIRVRPRVRAGLLVAVAAIALEGVLSQLLGRPLLAGGVLFPHRWQAVVPSGQMALSSALVLLSLVGAMAVGRSSPRIATGLGCFAFGL